MAAEVKPRSNRLFVLIGIVLAVAAFGLSLYVSRSGSGGGGSATQSVVVAKADIAAGTALTPDLVTTANVALAPRDAVLDPRAVSGQVAALPITANTPITQSLLSSPNAPSKALSAGLQIQKGYVALAIPAKEASDPNRSPELYSVGQYIQADDHIDILIELSNGTVRYGFQDVHVLRAGVNPGSVAAPASGQPATTGPSGAGAGVYIIELPRSQAELMTALLARSNPAALEAINNPKPNSNGQIDLNAQAKLLSPGGQVLKYVLRSRQDYNSGYQDSKPVDLPQKNDPGSGADDLTRLFGK
ncbi:MAG: Flp pilus assembly protein CpaB [Candidatus Dormibacteria bacterium]